MFAGRGVVEETPARAKGGSKGVAPSKAMGETACSFSYCNLAYNLTNQHSHIISSIANLQEG